MLSAYIRMMPVRSAWLVKTCPTCAHSITCWMVVVGAAVYSISDQTCHVLEEKGDRILRFCSPAPHVCGVATSIYIIFLESCPSLRSLDKLLFMNPLLRPQFEKTQKLLLREETVPNSASEENKINKVYALHRPDVHLGWAGVVWADTGHRVRVMLIIPIMFFVDAGAAAYDATLQQQFDALTRLLEDGSPQVRAVAGKVRVCRERIGLHLAGGNEYLLITPQRRRGAIIGLLIN